MLSKCYNRNNSVTNVDLGKNSYIVGSGTKKDIATPRTSHAHSGAQAASKLQTSCELESYKLQAERRSYNDKLHDRRYFTRRPQND